MASGRRGAVIMVRLRVRAVSRYARFLVAYAMAVLRSVRYPGHNPRLPDGHTGAAMSGWSPEAVHGMWELGWRPWCVRILRGYTQFAVPMPPMRSRPTEPLCMHT